MGSHLTKNVDFGFSNQLAKVAQQYATQQSRWLDAIAPALANIKTTFYPSNLRNIERLDLSDIEQVVMLDGVALYEVPGAELADKLIRATSSAARREILGRKWKEIATDCRAALVPCQSAEVAPLITYALDALDALETSNSHAAQSLAGSLIDTILRKYLPRTKPLIVPGKKTKTDAYLDFSVRQYIALAPIWQTYQHYFPDDGDPIPRTFNRHATAHTVSRQQYSRRNAVQGLMLVCGLLRFLDEQTAAQVAA